MKIFITGVSRGLGFCLAREFLAAGHQVFGLARSDPHESEPLNLLENNAGFVYYQADITDRQKVKHILSEMLASGIVPDAVILNAGIIKNDADDGLDFMRFSKIIDVNFLSAIMIVSTLLPKFMERRNGVFVAISSLAAIRALSSSIGYPAGKSALSMAFEGMRIHYSSFNIRFITVQPGNLAEKQTLFSASYPDAAKKIARHIILGKKRNIVNFPFIPMLISIASKIFPDGIMSSIFMKVLRKVKKKPG